MSADFPPIDPSIFEQGKGAYGRGASLQQLWPTLATMQEDDCRRHEAAVQTARAAEQPYPERGPPQGMSFLLGYVDGLVASIRRTEQALMMLQVGGDGGGHSGRRA
jgi:hypothetical protein